MVEWEVSGYALRTGLVVANELRLEKVDMRVHKRGFVRLVLMNNAQVNCIELPDP